MLVLVVALALGAAPPEPGQAADPPPVSEEDRKICRREVPVGSLIASQRICLTRKEWKKRAIEGNEAAREFYGDRRLGNGAR